VRFGFGSLSALVLFASLPAQANDWSVTEQVKTYPVRGNDALALYRSIEDNGPKTSLGTRAIALTEFDLRWRRDYQPDGSACVLTGAKPFLTITTTLPKPAGKLNKDIATRWKPFIGGITAHEGVHGKMIRELTAEIVTRTVGTRLNNDAACKKIRPLILEKVKAAYAVHLARSREFDRVEMGKGGNVEQLVRALVE
jgi:predicted secreted Zn-dependent protease